MHGAGMQRVDAIIFDKDGTLFDFQRTWGEWAADLLMDLGRGDPVLTDRLGAAVGFDTRSRRFEPGSPVIAGTPEEVVDLLLPVLGADVSRSALVARMNESASAAPLQPVTRLGETLAELSGRRLALGVVTNDAEAPARIHLARSGILEFFRFVAGYDSGFGAKPDAGPLLAFCDAVSVPPTATIMVGDSAHDLLAGRAAGMRSIGVLTGLASREALTPLAHAVVSDIGALPAWLDSL